MFSTCILDISHIYEAFIDEIYYLVCDYSYCSVLCILFLIVLDE